MRDLFEDDDIELEDDDIELEDAVEVMPKNETSQQFASGGIRECYPLKVLETGEELMVIEGFNVIKIFTVLKLKKPDRNGNTEYLDRVIAEAKIGSNGELEAVYPIRESKYRNLKIGDFLIKTAIQKYGCWWLWCNGSRAYKIYRKYGLLPIYNGLIRPNEEKIDFETHYKILLNGEIDPRIGDKAEVFDRITMCDKKHLSKFGLTYTKELEDFVKFMDANYKGYNFFGDSKKSYYVFTKVDE